MTKKVQQQKEVVVEQKELTVEEMIQKFGSKSKVMIHLYDEQQMSVSQISKLMNSHYSFVYGVIQRHTNGEIRKEEKVSKSDEFRKLYDSGITIGDIAKQLNSNYSYVFSVIKKYRESEDYKKRQQENKNEQK